MLVLAVFHGAFDLAVEVQPLAYPKLLFFLYSCSCLVHLSCLHLLLPFSAVNAFVLQETRVVCEALAPDFSVARMDSSCSSVQVC